MVMRLLLEKGTDINAADNNGRTALHWAAENWHMAPLRLLLEKGAHVTAADWEGKTALYYVQKARNDKAL
jgi:ankyrin repeat protein